MPFVRRDHSIGGFSNSSLKSKTIKRKIDVAPTNGAEFNLNRKGDEFRSVALIHIDIKKLGKFNRTGHRITGDRHGQSNSRGIGWEFAHVAIDDHSRLARIDIFPDEKKKSAVAFLKATVAYFRSLGVKVDRVMTDNGSCYRSFAFARACKRLGIKHIRTRPYTPQTNGKAERFIQTALREWAYATAFETSEQRRDELPNWLHRYNWHRPHASLGQMPPISRLGLTRNNLLRHHI